jgi:hypothetical protein
VVRLNNVERRMPDGGAQYYDVQVAPLQDNGGGTLGVSITFADVTHSQRLHEQLVRSSEPRPLTRAQSAHRRLERPTKNQSTNEGRTTNETSRQRGWRR